MHFLELVSSIDPRGGGVISGITALAAERAGVGDSTTVVSLDAPGSFHGPDLPFAWVGLGPGFGKFGYSSDYVPWVRQHAREYDLVSVHGLWQYHSFGAWQALSPLGIPYLVFPHGMLDPWFKRHYPMKHLRKLLYWWFAEYRVLRDSMAVCFTCDQERLRARESFRKYSACETVVGFGIVDPPPADPSQTAAFHRLVPASCGHRVLLFLSRLHEKKGCDLLLQAFAKVCAADPSWHLVMAGPDQDGCQARFGRLARTLGITERVSWPGMLSGDAKWGAFRSAEIFCLPSHQENFGVVVAESLACGCPVLLSDQVNIWGEVVADGAGLVGTDTIEGICGLLFRWMDSPAGTKQALRDQTRPSFIRRYHIAATSHRIRALVESAPPAGSRHVQDHLA